MDAWMNEWMNEILSVSLSQFKNVSLKQGLYVHNVLYALNEMYMKIDSVLKKNKTTNK